MVLAPHAHNRDRIYFSPTANKIDGPARRRREGRRRRRSLARTEAAAANPNLFRAETHAAQHLSLRWAHAFGSGASRCDNLVLIPLKADLSQLQSIRAPSQPATHIMHPLPCHLRPDTRTTLAHHQLARTRAKKTTDRMQKALGTKKLYFAYFADACAYYCMAARNIDSFSFLYE